VHRPSARRARAVLTLAVSVAAPAPLALAACADDGPIATSGGPDALGVVDVVTVAAQRCETPNRAHGLGVVVAPGTVVTAGHTVEGNLRALEVDGRPGVVRLLDRTTDLAVLDVLGLPGPSGPDIMRPATRSDSALVDTAMLVRPDGASDVRLLRRETLVVDHASDDATYRRHVVVFAPGVIEGDSGAPLVGEEGSLVGVVILTRDDREAYAVTAAEVADLLRGQPAGDGDELGSDHRVDACSTRDVT
jgi:Trypsin-like peptidase domain